jgi:hypothetical protein
MSMATAPKNPAEELERDLLKRLGLPPTASPDEVSTAHQAVVAFLSNAPHDLANWARTQAAGADEAYALLTDPAALASSAALVERAARLQVPPGGPATPPARRETPPAITASKAKAVPKPTVAPDADQRSAADDEEFEAMLAAVTPSAHRDAVPGAHKGASDRDTADDDPAGQAIGVAESYGVTDDRRRFPMKHIAMVGAVLVGAVAIGMVGYNAGGGGAANGATGGDTAGAGNGTDTATTPESTLDEAAVAALMEKIQANPNDIDTLLQLGDQFYAAEDFATAASWFAKAAEVDPKETKALLALGASKYNQGSVESDQALLDEAEAAWQQVLVIDPKNVEAHYDLGFLYLYQQPPDMEGVEREWGQVVTLAPDTDIAKTVQAHLDALASASPGTDAASPAASAAPSAAPASPAPASPAPSGSTEP